MTPKDILRLPDEPEYYKRIDDVEVKLLSALVTSRVRYVGDAKRISSMMLELKQRMKSEIVHFVYDKKEGEERPAFGTRCSEIICRYDGDPKGRQQEGPLKTFKYFDLVRKEWRAFRPENLVSIDMNYSI